MLNNTLEEISLLLQFGDQSSQQGLKIHSSASDSNKTAATRLFDKGLISQVDGGYLTDRGTEALEHAQHLTAILNT